MTFVIVLFGVFNVKNHTILRAAGATKADNFCRFYSFSVSMLTTFGSLCNTVGHWMPKVGDQCICEGLYIASMTFYVLALYAVKAIFFRILKTSNPDLSLVSFLILSDDLVLIPIHCI